MPACLWEPLAHPAGPEEVFSPRPFPFTHCAPGLGPLCSGTLAVAPLGASIVILTHSLWIQRQGWVWIQEGQASRMSAEALLGGLRANPE